MKHGLILFVLGAFLWACSPAPPTLTPTPSLTGPTLEPTAIFFPFVPTNEPFEAAILGANDPTAAALPSGAELPPLALGSDPSASRQPILVTAADGAQLAGEFYRSPASQPAPGLLLLAADRTGWLDLPLRLQASGFNVMSIDARPNGTVGDIEILLRSMIEIVDAVDASRIGVVAAEASADLALAACAQGAPCDVLALISPVQETAVMAAILSYNPRPLFLSAGEDDAALAVIEMLRSAARGPVEQVTAPGSARGTALVLGSPTLSEALIAWLRSRLNP